MSIFTELDANWRIERIDYAMMIGQRRRSAGCNARLGEHGQTIRCPMVRVTIGGVTGYGWSRVSREAAAALVGAGVRAIFADGEWIRERFLPIQFALLDWLGQVKGKPVYELIARNGALTGGPLTVPCYDTSLYFDDLHLASHADAVKLIQEEAMQGYEEGFRGFKIKVGRGALHMDVMEGTLRDILIVNGVREAVGAECNISIDANNGYNLNLTKRVLAETAESRLLWIEEAFHEDPMLYRHLKDWLAERGMQVMIADGEGQAAAPIVEWAEAGLIDAIQYDLKDYGLVGWLKLGERLDRSGIKSAPHNYGGFYGNFASCHVYPAIDGFLFVEWDQAQIPGIDASGYSIRDGRVSVPADPGFGLRVDDAHFTRLIGENGWTAAE